MCKMQLNIYISLGFYLPSCELRRRAFPCAEVGRNSQAPARMMRKTPPPENLVSKHISPTLGCTFTHPGMHFHPSHHLCKLLVQPDPAMWSLWVTLVSARPLRVLLPTHPPSHQQEQDFSYGKAKGKAKQKRFLLTIPLVLIKLLNQPFGIK